MFERSVVSTPDAPAAIGPYSQAISARGKLLFCSGQISLNADGTRTASTIEEQTELCCQNLIAVLDAQGLTLANVVKTTIFLSSMDHFAKVNEVYGRHFAVEPPARSTVAVAGLPKSVDVEIEAIAVH